MSYLLSKRTYLMVLLSIVMVVIFTTFGQKKVLAGEIVRSFHLPSALMNGSGDVRPREIPFTAKNPGVIVVDASWEPSEKKLTLTLYDQNGKSLVSETGVSPVHLVYTYTQEHLKKVKFQGNSFRIKISRSLFKAINGSIKIRIPDKKVVEEDDSINVRGPFGTFKEEKVEKAEKAEEE